MLKETENIDNWGQLQPYGINALTMESCAYSMRMLCDLSEEGVELTRSYLGLTTGDCFASNWNSKVGNKPAIASVMLITNSLLDFASFILLRKGCEVITKNKYGVRGMSKTTYDSYKEDYPNCFSDHVVLFSPNIQNSSQPSVNGRNVHAFSQRTK